MADLNDDDQKSYWSAEHDFRGFDHPIVKFFAQQRIDYLGRFIDLHSISSILDVGCGSGFSKYYLSQVVPNTYGIDRSRRMLSQNPSPYVGLVEGDATRLPFVDDSFEFVCCWELLHHLEQPLDAIREMARVSRRWVIIFEPNRYNPAQFLFALSDPAHRWVLKYSLSYMTRLVESADLNLVHKARVGCIFPNKTPQILFELLKRAPFRLPFMGISNLVVCSKEGS